MAEQEDDEVCEAKLEDRDSVMAIDEDVYDGIDFLPDTYPSLLQQEGVRCYLYKVDGKIIGFMSTQLINGRQTLLVSATRIAKEYRDVGILRRFKQLAIGKYLDDVLSTAPKLDKITFAVHDKKVMKDPQNKQVAIKKLMSLKGTMSNGSLAEDLPEMRELSLKEMTDICKNAKEHDLFPDGIIILGWKPYRAMVENVAVFTHHSSNRVFLVNKTSDEKSFPRFFSAGSYFTCKKGIYYITDLFGDTSNEDLRGHINWHMKRLSEKAEETEQDVVFSICYSPNLDGAVENLPLCYGLEKANLCVTEIIVIEQNLS